jgi:signal transduction histidine kinase
LMATQAALHALIDFRGLSVNMVDVEQDECTVYTPGPQGVAARSAPGVLPSQRHVVETGQPLYRRRRKDIERWSGTDVWADDVQSVLDVPFIRGTVAIDSPRPEAFCERDIAVAGRVVETVSQACRRLDDMRALRQSEEQFHQAQRLEAVGQLASGVAHDFNNVLTVIDGYTQLALRKADADLRGELEEVQRAAKQGASLVRQLLAFSRGQVLKPEMLDVRAVVRDLEQILHRVLSDKIQLTLELDSEAPSVWVDEGQLQQVLMNLAINARDAMPDGGLLKIRTEAAAMPRGQRRQGVQVQPGTYVRLAVSDTGGGMDAETQERIFEPFFTTKEAGKGTGLGLASVYGIVKQSGGHVWVSSELGKGSTFEILLRCASEGDDRKTVTLDPGQE